jgi:arsenate reductase (glutaredoxin)
MVRPLSQTRIVKATIWHNPRCSKSREALALLRDAGAEVTVIEYLKQPPPRDELVRLFARAGIDPRAGLRRDAPGVADDAAALDLMAADPSTIERPLVETERGVVLARPPARVRAML